jgi:FixJ family two-component response regulator
MKELSQTVFVVDDDDAVRNSLKLLLKSAGLHAEVFGSAPEFLTKYEAAQPGCLVLDVRMPGMSGLEMQHELNLRGATIPVIFTSSPGMATFRWPWKRCSTVPSTSCRNHSATRNC